MANRPPDLRRLARRQRWMLWLILAAIASQSLFLRAGGLMIPYVLVFLFMLQFLTCVLMSVGVVLLLNAQGNHILLVIICGILMLVPWGNLLLALLIDRSVTRTLRRAGVRVGLMGAKYEDVERIINPALCNGCGYNLTGNVSGYCPECGRVIR